MPNKFKIKIDRSVVGSIGDNSTHKTTNIYQYRSDIYGLATFHEHFDSIEKQVLKVSLSLFVISIVIFITAKLVFKDTSICDELIKIPIAILGLSIAFIFFKSILRHNKNRGAFWKKITRRQQEIINEYLEHVESEVRSNFGNIDVTFKDIAGDSDNHIPLSGHLYTHQAIEEKAPRFRRQINNLDVYILSPVNKQIFLYGSPGSGKSTTLYKAFRSYKSDAVKGRGNYIPIFIHANQILKILSYEYPVEIYSFLKSIYHLNLSDDALNSFVELLELRLPMNFVCIVDALDEFSDRTKRNELFNLLSKLIDATSRTGTKWILSCREDEYRAYRRTLNVTNIRIKPMNLNQTEVFLSKRLKSYNFGSEDVKHAKIALVNIQRLENKRESFLSNPYYLSLWLQNMIYNPKEDHSGASQE
jgi:NACHT domain